MKINMTDKYQTRDGKPARVICVDKKTNPYPVIALVTLPNGAEVTCHYTLNGESTMGNEDSSDLILAPKVIKGWINVFKDGTQIIHGSQEAADLAAAIVHDTRIACIYFEGKEGEGL